LQAWIKKDYEYTNEKLKPKYNKKKENKMGLESGNHQGRHKTCPAFFWCVSTLIHSEGGQCQKKMVAPALNMGEASKNRERGGGILFNKMEMAPNNKMRALRPLIWSAFSQGRFFSWPHPF